MYFYQQRCYKILFTHTYKKIIKKILVINNFCNNDNDNKLSLLLSVTWNICKVNKKNIYKINSINIWIANILLLVFLKIKFNGKFNP